MGRADLRGQGPAQKIKHDSNFLCVTMWVFRRMGDTRPSGWPTGHKRWGKFWVGMLNASTRQFSVPSKNAGTTLPRCVLPHTVGVRTRANGSSCRDAQVRTFLLLPRSTPTTSTGIGGPGAGHVSPLTGDAPRKESADVRVFLGDRALS